MVLGARRAQLAAIDCALTLGLEVLAVDPDPYAPGLARSHYPYVADLADEAHLVDLARRHRISGVMTLAAEYPMPALGRICSELSLCGPSPEAVLKATNKRCMRAAFLEAGVLSPRSLAANNSGQAADALAAIATDCLFKPVMSHGGRGITRVPADAPRSFIESAFARAVHETRAEGILVEEFVEGPEFSVEALTWRGQTQVIALTDKSTSGAPYCVELGHSQPSTWPEAQIALLRDAAVNAVTSLGLDNTASHTELKLTKAGACIIEVAARLGGGFIGSHLVPLSCGFDMVRASVEMALGHAPEVVVQRRQGAAIRFLQAQPGIVTAVSGVEAVAERPGIVWANVYVQPGERVLPLLDARARVGHVIAVGCDVHAAITLADEAQRQISIRCRPA